MLSENLNIKVNNYLMTNTINAFLVFANRISIDSSLFFFFSSWETLTTNKMRAKME